MANPNLLKKKQETTKKILNWLYEFKYSKISILQKVTGLTRPGLGEALKKLKNDGLVNQLKPSLPLKTVWGITWDGICEIGHTDENRRFESSKFNELTAIHHYNLQELKLLLLEKGVTMTATKRAHIGTTHKTPDGIIKRDNQIIAIELERTVKTKQRYQIIWGNYIEEIRNGRYSAVQYFLPNNRTQNIPKIFDQTKTIIISKKSVSFTPELRQVFKFTDISSKISGTL